MDAVYSHRRTLLYFVVVPVLVVRIAISQKNNFSNFYNFSTREAKSPDSGVFSRSSGRKTSAPIRLGVDIKVDKITGSKPQKKPEPKKNVGKKKAYDKKC
jgi:hypothetical protein